MNRKLIVLSSIIILLLFPLSSCIGLIPLEEDEPDTGGYGPQVSLQEHQMETFDALWTVFQDNYIYYDTAGVDWNTLRAEYHTDIEKGLTADEFVGLLKRLEEDLPANSLLYQSRADRIDTDTADNSTYDGIGAFIGFNPEPEPHIILLSIMGGSPAEKAGLKAHDSILAIDGEPILLEEGTNAVQRVRGPSGSSVTLTVRSPGKPEHAVEVQRGKLATRVSLEAHQITGTNYGYLLFPPVAYASLYQDVLTAMQTFTTNRTLEGLILDFRIAGSSGSWPLQNFLTMFYDGAIGEFYNRSGKQLVQVKGQDVFNSQSVPLIILIGKNTQGYPEIMAGSLQKHKRALIIGETSSGIFETSTSYLLPDGSRVFIETTSFALPNGDQLGFDGIQPDVKVEAGWDDVIPTQDPVLDAAIKELEAEQ